MFTTRSYFTHSKLILRFTMVRSEKKAKPMIMVTINENVAKMYHDFDGGGGVEGTFSKTLPWVREPKVDIRSVSGH